MENQWTRIGEVMLLEAHALKARWKCDMPPNDALPDAQLDRMVSHWCRRLARNLTLPIDPPASVRPWVLARLICASVEARQRGTSGTAWSGLPPAGIARLLTGEWDARFRDEWAKLVLLDEFPEE